jgi:hypothetical protein
MRYGYFGDEEGTACGKRDENEVIAYPSGILLVWRS